MTSRGLVGLDKSIVLLMFTPQVYSVGLRMTPQELTAKLKQRSAAKGTRKPNPPKRWQRDHLPDKHKIGDVHQGRLSVVSNGGIFEPNGSRLCDWIVLVWEIDDFPAVPGIYAGNLRCRHDPAGIKSFEFTPA